MESSRLPVAVGCALYSNTFSWDGKTLNLRCFIVQESYRSKGVGKILFNDLLKRAQETGCNRVEFDVDDWNTRARKFYENMGAVNVTERNGYSFYRVCKDEIDNA